MIEHQTLTVPRATPDAPPAPEQVSVSVLVACTRPELVDGIAAALAADGSVACELVVAGDVEGVDPRRWGVPGRVVECADPHSNVRRRLAIEHSSGPILAFLDDDALPEAGWIDAAARLPDGSREIWTGPERPSRSGPGPRLAHAVASSWVAEGTRAHVHRQPRRVHWSEAPFCNLVMRRELLDVVGPPSVEVVWDIDDFEFCHRASGAGVAFVCRPDLAIRHDRYPDRVTAWLAGNARDRRRTGEKFVEYPELYHHVPGAVVAAVAPPLALVLAVLLSTSRRGRKVIAAAAGGYVAMATVAAVGSGRSSVGDERIPPARFVALLVANHVVSLAAFQVGWIGALAAAVGRRTRPDDRAATTDEGVAWRAPC